MLAAGAPGIFGTLPGWLTVAGILLAAWIFYRGGGGTAIQSLQTANQVLEKRVHEQGLQIAEQDKRVAEQDKTIAELRGRTDVSLVVAPIIEAAQHHELRAQERHDKTLVVLDLIASRLGTDPNGHTA